MRSTDNFDGVVSEYEKKWVDGLNTGNVSVADEVFKSDCVIRINGAPKPDLSVSEFKDMLAGMLIAFPDLNFIVNEQFNSGEKFCTRWTATGTNTGPFGEMQPTGKSIVIQGFIIDQVADGMVENRWELWDQMAMMQQLGLA